MESNPSRNENEPNGDIPIKLMDCYVCTAADSSLTTFSASCAQSLPQPAFPTLRQGQEVHLYPVRTVLIIYLHTLLPYTENSSHSLLQQMKESRQSEADLLDSPHLDSHRPPAK